MPFLLLRTASVLAAGFLLTGPSAPAVNHASSNTGSLAVGAVAPCPAQWTADQYQASQAQPAGLNSQITAIAALSPTDVWMLITRTDNHRNNVSDVYHLVGTERRESADLDDIERSFAAKWIVARSDTDVWVVGSAHGAVEAWHYNGSSWTDHPPTRYSSVGVDAAALGSNGILYLAGSNGHAHAGIIVSYDGSHWADLSPANPPYDYKALAVTTGGTLIAAGGGRNDGSLQERSGATWTTVTLSAPVSAITRVSVAPSGTVYGVGSAAGDQQVLIMQPPGSRSATVLDAPAAEQPATFTNKAGAVPLGLDVWLLGEDGPHDGWHHSWITHDDSGFVAARRRMSQAWMGPSSGLRSGRPCWPAAAAKPATGIGSLPGSTRCARWREGYGTTWSSGAYPVPARSSRAGLPVTTAPQVARPGTPSQAPPSRSAHGLPPPLPEERQAWFTPAPAPAATFSPYHGAGAGHFAC
jgi:hypothetical protein